MPIEHLYFDEDMSQELGDILRRMGYIVHTVEELEVRSEDDSTHLRISTEREWILLTQNRKDFRRLHWLWMTFYNWGVLQEPHGGILTIYQQRSDLLVEWATAIDEFLQPRDTLKGKMYMWRPSRNRWDEDPVRFM